MAVGGEEQDAVRVQEGQCRQIHMARYRRNLKTCLNRDLCLY
jgi:hypothetical protein